MENKGLKLKVLAQQVDLDAAKQSVDGHEDVVQRVTEAHKLCARAEEKARHATAQFEAADLECTRLRLIVAAMKVLLVNARVHLPAAGPRSRLQRASLLPLRVT